MALLKVKTNDEGVTTTYHKVNNVTVRDNTLHCFVNSYVSQDYREVDRSADSSAYRFEITLEEEESMGSRKLAYKKIKELPEWEGAEDC